MSRHTENNIAFAFGALVGRYFGIPIFLFVLFMVVKIIVSIAEILAVWLGWLNNLCTALIDSFLWMFSGTGMGTAVAAHIVIGVLLGLAIGLRAPKPQRH